MLPLDSLLAIAHQAGDILLNFYQASNQVSTKPDQSPVSEADFAADHFIREALTSLGLGYPVISEEQAPTTTEKHSESFWIVDPLDGTRGFIEHSAEFVINIALVQGNSIPFGLIHAPALNQTYWAQSGHGAFCQHGKSAPTRISVRTFDLTSPTALISKHHPGKEQEALAHIATETSFGTVSSALKFATIAEGRNDIYFRLSSLHLWDIAPAAPIIQEAGGTFCPLRASDALINRETLKAPPFISCGKTSQKTLQTLQDNLRRFLD